MVVKRASPPPRFPAASPGQLPFHPGKGQDRRLGSGSGMKDGGKSRFEMTRSDLKTYPLRLSLLTYSYITVK